MYVTGQAQANDRLPKGPHGLTREQVQASQRQRILDATLDAIGGRGYNQATVGHITNAAHVSRTAFYEQFADKQDAFIAAYDAYGQQFFEEFVAASVTAATPFEASTVCGQLLIEWGRRRPAAARAFLLEIYAAGERGLKHRDQIMQLAATIFQQAAAWARRLDPTLPPQRPLIARAVIAASFELCAQALRAPDQDEAFDVARDAVVHTWLLGMTGREQISANNGRR